MAGLVDEAVPADAACWSTFDPATTMVTSAIGRNLDEGGEAAARFFELEYALDVPGRYRQLASAGETVVVQDSDGSVIGEGHGVVCDHLGSMGFVQELRVLFHLQRAGWGGAGLMRATGSRAFGEDETMFLRHISPVVATGVRTSLVRSVPMVDIVDDALTVRRWWCSTARRSSRRHQRPTCGCSDYGPPIGVTANGPRSSPRTLSPDEPSLSGHVRPMPRGSSCVGHLSVPGGRS